MLMKLRNSQIKEDSYQDSVEISTIEHDGVEEEFASNQFPIKSSVMSAVMMISIGLIIGGVSSIQKEPEVYNTGKAEQSKWSDFDTTKINRYFNILSSGSEYKMLNAMCSDGSKVYSTIKSNEEEMQHLYDKYYGITQAYQKFGSYMRISHINGVFNNKVCLSIRCVLYDDITEFFNLYARYLNRFFTSHELSVENVVRELFYLLDTYKISTSEIAIELPVKEVDGLYTISDDSEVVRLIRRTYMVSINIMVRQINMHR